ncbi:hypothetical protein [Faecalispora anaeroviscerum]|uniref:hypothetical protein n=1 Tax=Faecalispora anaeroviscerum TaxID=2991836 RepID=UPI0024BBD0F2|nr:hypothetical protein [Faecalispora anaeroviscerum]
MKVKLIGFFSSIVLVALILGILRWVNWIDDTSVVAVVVAVLLVTLLDFSWRWLWNQRKQKNRRVSGQPEKPYYSSFELSGYLTIDAFHWLKQKAEQLFQSTKEKKN